MRKYASILLTILMLVILASGCNQEPEGPGTMQFYTNGGDRVFVGMVSKDGWKMVFNHFYVTMTDITSFQTDPPYDPIYSADIIRYETSVSLEGIYTSDIAQGGGRRLVDEIMDAPAGLYNAVSWYLTPGAEGNGAGHSIVMMGQAGKDDVILDFTLKLNFEGGYQCGNYFISGSDVKDNIGELAGGGATEKEMTYAVEVLFGDGGQPATGILNRVALGFEPLATLAKGGVIDEDLSTLEQKLNGEDFELLMGAVPELGKVGEGRCFYFEP